MDLLHSTAPRLHIPDDPQLLDRLLVALSGSGLTGRGGGAFPTATKINSARGRRPRLIINACDGEPLVIKDEVLLRTSPGLVLDGARLVAAALAASEVVLAVHRGSATETKAREMAATHGWRVLGVPARYVSSEASALVSLLDGGPARPQDKPVHLTHRDPGSVLVLNAETVAQIALLWAGRRGPLHRLVTVSGAVRLSGVLETADSATVAELIARAGGLTEPPRAILLGGYGGQWLPWREASPLSLAALADAGYRLGPGLVHVLGSACPVDAVGEILGYLAAESAGQCGPCMFGLPAIAADWVELGDPIRSGGARERLGRRLPVVSGRGACTHPDGVVRMTASALRTFDAHLTDHRVGACDAPVTSGARR